MKDSACGAGLPVEPEAEAGFPGLLAIDLDAIRSNYRRLADKAAPARTAGVVKADAYGLGAAKVAPLLAAEGCRDFFVAHLMEALALKPLLPETARLYVLNGLLPGAEAACRDAGVVPVLNSPEQFKRWRDAAAEAGLRLPALLQFDTGMSRLGFAPADRAWLAEALRAAGDLIEPLFIMSHLASADAPQSGQNGAQLAEMQKIREAFSGIALCFANSGGIFLGPDYRGALVRPGIALYGGAPFAGDDNPMAPVVRLDIAVIQTRTVPADSLVGYGGTHVTKGAETRLATLAAGYADGLPRCLGGRGAVYHNGIRLPIVGRVSMDSMTVDITALSPDALGHGDFVQLIGPDQTLEQLAEAAGTISYEILTGLGRRYRRVYR